MFFGEHEHSLDDKGRITIPAAFRDELSGEVFVTRGPHRQLLVFPREAWERLVPRIRREALSSDVPRVLFSGAMAQVDRHGRVVLPPGLRAFGGLEPNEPAIVNGVAEHMEIWSVANWNAAMESAMAETHLTEALRKLGL